jgi:hypothetical protein
VHISASDTSITHEDADDLIDEALLLGKTMIGKYFTGVEATSFHLSGVYLMDACTLPDGGVVARIGLHR